MATYSRRRAEADSFEGVDKDPGRVKAGKKGAETRKYYEGEDVMREQGRKGGEARRGSGTSDDLSSMASYFHTLDTKDRRRVQAGKQAAETRRQREGEDVFRQKGQKGQRARGGGRDDEDSQGEDQGSTGKRTRDRDSSDRDEDEQDSGYQKRRRSLDQGKDQRRVEAGKKAAETRKAREGEEVMKEQGRKGGRSRRGQGGRGSEDEDQGQDGRESRHEQRVRAGKKGAAARWAKAHDEDDQGQDEDEEMGHESRHEQHVRAGRKGAAARWGKAQDDDDQSQDEDSGHSRRGVRREGRSGQDYGGDEFDYPDQLSDEEFVDAITHNKNPNRVLAGKKTAVTRRAHEGPDVFSRLGKAGAEARRAQTRGQGDRDDDQSESEHEHEQEMYIHRVIGGMKGARTRMQREGADVFSRMGKAGAEARWGHSVDRDDEEGQEEDNQDEHEQEVHSHRVIGGIKAALTRKQREGPEVFHEMGRMGAAARWRGDSQQNQGQSSSGHGRGHRGSGSRDDDEEDEDYQSEHDREVHEHRVLGGKKGAQTMKKEFGDDIHHRLGEMGARARWGR